MKRIRYSRNLSDTCLVNVYRDVYEGKIKRRRNPRPIRPTHVVPVYLLRRTIFKAEEGETIMTPVINIGLNVKGVETLTPLKVLEALRAVGIEPARFGVKQSNTEKTLVIEARKALTEETGLLVASRLEQDAIAQVDSHGHGELFGPKAKEWGPFNPEYFLTL